ncbi:MAG: ROK family protein [Planctomycetota bacterium]
MRTVLAGDLGGTKCRFALVAEDGTVVAAERVATSRDRAQFLAALEQGIERVLARRPDGLAPPDAIGMGTAGVIEPDGRAIARAPNLPLDGFALAGHLEQRFGLRATLLNDGRASAWGEYRTGAARGADPLLCLFFGTGIGIGLMVGGAPYAGADNAAGEIGHTLHVPGGEPCPCGGRGHYEAYCGGRPIGERGLRELGPPPDGHHAWHLGNLAGRTDAAARRIFDEAVTAAGALTANAITLFNPRAVVIGGGVVDGWPPLRERVEAFVRRECAAMVTDKLRFHPSLGGSDAILVGAAAAAGR